MPIPDEVRNELETARQRFLRMLVPLQTPDGEGHDTQSDPQRPRLALWTAVKALDPLLAEAQVPPDLDLTSDDPDIRQVIRDFVVREYFSLHLLDDPGDIHVPVHTPESCDLRVFFQYGRWFVTWLKLDHGAPLVSERSARVLLVFEKDQNDRFVFTEV